MNFKLIAALALVSAAISSASPALATPTAGLHEHRGTILRTTVTRHRPMAVAHAAPAVREAAPQAMPNDDWPNNLDLGSLKTRNIPTTVTLAI